MWRYNTPRVTPVDAGARDLALDTLGTNDIRASPERTRLPAKR